MSDSQEDADKKKLEQKKPEQSETQPAPSQPAKQVAPRVGTPIGQSPTPRPQIGTPIGQSPAPRPQVGTPIGAQKDTTAATTARPTVGTPVGTQRPVVGTPVGTPRPSVGTPIKPTTATAQPQATAATPSPSPSPTPRPPPRPAAPKAPVKTLRAAGPIIVLILIVAASFLGYYQVVYYPTIAPTSTTTSAIPTTPFTVTVTIPSGAAGQGQPTSFYYQPDSITVYIGYNSTVIWVNNDTTVHTVTADGTPPDPRFAAWGPNNPSSYNNVYYAGSGETPLSVNFTFTIAGVYNYSCSYHPWMKGEVIVKTAPAGLTTSTKSA